MSEDLMDYMERGHAAPAAEAQIVQVSILPPLWAGGDYARCYAQQWGGVCLKRDYGGVSGWVTVTREPKSTLVQVRSSVGRIASVELSATAPELRLIAQALLSAAVDIEREAGQ